MAPSSVLWIPLTVLLFSFLLSLTSAQQTCQHPPSDWCDSREIAQACQVEKQCLNYFSNELPKKNGVPAVRVEVYYESLCGGCRSYIMHQLYPTWLMIGDIMNITLVPFGNAEETKGPEKWEFSCQHGPEECLGNTMEACLIYLLKDVEDYFPIIYCMETSSNVTGALKPCLEIYQEDLPLKTVMECVNGDQGNKLMHYNAQLTNALQPPHTYVPWLVINGKHDKTLESLALNAMFKLTCDLYTGEKPEACSGKNMMPVKRNSVCFN